MSQREAAKALGVAEGTVRNEGRRHQLEVRGECVEALTAADDFRFTVSKLACQYSIEYLLVLDSIKWTIPANIKQFFGHYRDAAARLGLASDLSPHSLGGAIMDRDTCGTAARRFWPTPPEAGSGIPPARSFTYASNR
jgi:hypothetical protein